MKDLYAPLRAAGWHEHSHNSAHGTLSAVILKRWLQDKGASRMQASQLAAVIGGHHGDWISATEMKYAHGGQEKWQALQNEICAELEELLGICDFSSLPKASLDFNTFAAFLSGFVSVCDWIGSDSDFFQFEEQLLDLETYYQRSLAQAQTALTEKGWGRWQADGSAPAFETVFPFAPNDLQSAGIETLGDLPAPPRLILVEYPTGGGKTELALHIADQLLNRFGLRGTYFAMPTQATSNQMFDRVADYLTERYKNENINLQLIHGAAAQQLQQIKARPERDGDESGLNAEAWFQNRKRALLAPYGVGTIDQAMLSALQVKHHFVRQFGLSHKIVVFDEIHSYGTYMNVIIERLLRWLQALQTPLILLSATLSRQNRADILRAVGAGDAAEDALAMPYPRLTVVAHDGHAQAYALPRPAPRRVKIERIDADDSSLLDALLPRYEKGGCIAVVCNTVNESIKLARCLRETEGIAAADVWLFHARFPPALRAEIEQDVLNTFGKGGERPERAILVATQIIEQSLDLDFDLMVSRTAPIDLLIQRVGRLHRHPRSRRPAHLAEPTLLLRRSEMDAGGIPDFGVDELIYERLFLLKTWLKLREMTALTTPADVDALIDFVYSKNGAGDELDADYRAALRKAAEDLSLHQTNSKFRGGQHVIGGPSDELLIGRWSAGLPDDEEKHVATRDIRPGTDIICLVDAELEQMSQRRPSKADLAALLQYRVTIRQVKVRLVLEDLPEHDPWRRKPQLRYARPRVFTAGRHKLQNSPYTLHLTSYKTLRVRNY